MHAIFERIIQDDPWLRLLYVPDQLGNRHYERSGSLFRAGDEVAVTRTVNGVVVRGYGLAEAWKPLPPATVED